MSFEHITVLRDEAIKALTIDANGIYVDMTLGGGGHSREIIKHLKNGHLYAFDQDLTAINYNKKQFEKEAKITIIHNNFLNATDELKKLNITEINGVLYDLGVSSPQIDESERGFSYRFNGPLDMRMNQTQQLTAAIVVNTYSEKELIKILKNYGEEKFAHHIVKNIIKYRNIKTIETTGELTEIIYEAIPQKFKYMSKNTLAKKTFQALRIEVNDEINVLKKSLELMYNLLKPGGIMAVITFHSLEDKIVKKFFKTKAENPEFFNQLPEIPNNFQNQSQIITKKGILPSNEELLNNKRSKSSRLRVLKK